MDRQALQQDVDRVVLVTGGYISPLDMLSLLASKINAVVMEARGDDRDSLEQIVGECCLLTLCIANQYVIDMRRCKATASSELSETVLNSVLYSSLSEKIDTLEQTLAFYHRAGYQGVSGLVSTVEESLCALFADFTAACGSEDKLERQLRRAISSWADDHRTVQENVYDAATSKSVRAFGHIRDRTHCLFAPRARLWGAPSWNLKRSIEENARAISPSLELFSRVAAREALDGFVVEVTDERIGGAIPTLAAFLLRFLKALDSIDPSEQRSFDEEVEHEDWQFSYNGVRLFVIVFAPCYGPDNSRHTFGLSSTFVFFQPEASFVNFHVARGESRASVRDKIREAFDAHGMGYDLEIISQPYEAPRYLKPLRKGDPIVEWWKVFE